MINQRIKSLFMKPFPDFSSSGKIEKMHLRNGRTSSWTIKPTKFSGFLGPKKPLGLYANPVDYFFSIFR